MEPSNTNKDLGQFPASMDQAKSTKNREEDERENDISNLDAPDHKETSINEDSKDAKLDEIMKELKSLKKSNQITNCLVSVLIVVTAVWQLSEVSLFLSVKGMVANPVKSLGDFVLGGFNGKGKKRAAEALAVPPVVVPELPRVEIPCINLNGDNE